MNVIEGVGDHSESLEELVSEDIRSPLMHLVKSSHDVVSQLAVHVDSRSRSG